VIQNAANRMYRNSKIGIRYPLLTMRWANVGIVAPVHTTAMDRMQLMLVAWAFDITLG